MREIIFEEVGMEHFGPYIDPMILEFKPNRLTLMTGKNGIGKTMSLDAIPFTFFNNTTKGMKGDACVNNTVGENCKTWVKFKINDDNYICTRYQKYKKIGNSATLNKNGIDIAKGKEVSEQIEKLLCTEKAFMNTLMFGQKVKNFFTDLVDSDKKDIFRKILSLEQYLVYYKKADEKLKNVRKQIEDLQTQNRVDTQLLVEAEDQIIRLVSEKSKFYEEKAESINKYIQAKKEKELTLNKLNDELSLIVIEDMNDLFEKVSKIQTEISNLKLKYESAKNNLISQSETKKSELSQEALRLREGIIKIHTDDKEKINKEEIDLINKKNKIIDNYKHQIYNFDMEINQSKFSILELQKRIEKIKSSVIEKNISTCPTCEQSITQEVIDKFMEELQDLQSNIDKFNNQIIVLNASKEGLSNTTKISTDEVDKSLYELTKKIEAINLSKEAELNNAKDRLNNALTQINQLVKSEIEKIEKSLKEDGEKFNTEFVQLNSRISEAEKLSKERKEVEGNISTIQREIAIINNNIENIEIKEYDETQKDLYIQKQKSLENKIIGNNNNIKGLEKKIAVFEFWKAGFSSSGIPSMLIDESIPFMNETISKYLDSITNGRYIVSFDTLDKTKAGEYKDKISVNVLDTNTKANQRTQLSGGQTRIIDIATILTLGDLQSVINNVKFNILIFDEIFDALDDENISYVSRVLNELKKTRTIYIISHQHQEHLEADETLKFT